MVLPPAACPAERQRAVGENLFQNMSLDILYTGSDEMATLISSMPIIFFSKT